MDPSAALSDPLGSAPFLPYPFRRPLLLLVLFVVGALYALSLWRPSSGSTPVDAPPWGSRPVLLIGRVAGYPSGRTDGDSFQLRLTWVQPSGAPAFRSDERVILFRKKPTETFTWGDTVSVWGPWIAADAGRRRRGISAQVFVPEGRSVLLRRASPFNPVRWAAGLRGRFHAAFKKHLPESSNHLLCGILLGDRPLGLEAFAADFRRSGTYHLLVASGSNVGFALGVWWLFSRWILWWPRRWTIASAPFISFLYALMAGGDPPVLRAAVMASVGAAGALLGRWDRLEHPLILSAGILLLWDPTSLHHAGFQMSYAATLAIAVVWGSRRSVTDDAEEASPPLRSPWGWIRKGAWSLFITSMAAQVALAPFLLYYFGRFSWVGIGANMLAVPLSGLCLFLGTGLAFLDSVWPAAASLWAVPTRWGAEALAGWAHLCAKMPGGEWQHSFNGRQTFALSLGILFGFISLYYGKKRAAVVSIVSLGTLVAVWGFASPKTNGALEVAWTGGRTPSVRVRTEKEGTVFKKGEPSRIDPLLVDGTHWSEGETRWEVIRPLGGNGFALRLKSEKTNVLLNFGLTGHQQAVFVGRSPDPVDLLSWTGAGGGPPSDELLTLLNPRWIVYQGTRIPLSVRQSGGAVVRPRRSGLHWRTDSSFTGFYPND